MVPTNNEVECERALAPLYRVNDPEIGLNVVDLGLIYEIQFEEAIKKITCRMTVTSQACPMTEAITDGVYQALHSVFPDDEIEIRLTFEPPWSQDMITEQGRIFLSQ
ncbi:MAG: metal-sulfur cluster assembly factor [Bacteroidetes bacterium]|nr:metal-sulfur cluster assembly factor [Bacteroidota bacterium]